VINSVLAAWYGWRLVSALVGGSGGAAALQVGPLVALLVTGPLLLWRVPSVHRMAVAAALLGILWTATVAFVQLAMRGLWDIPLDAVVGAMLAVYLIGVHGFLRQPGVRGHFLRP
jgi:hypothetical protein